MNALLLVVGGVFNGVKTAASRWLSVSRTISFVLAGHMFFNILPRAWRLAFGEAEVPQGLKDNGEDYHTYVKSKVRRVSVWFQMPETDIQNIVFSHISTPVEHLMMQLQALDVAGGTLLELIQVRTSPLWQCLVTYASFVTDPMTTLKTLWTHAMAGPIHRAAVLARVMLGRTVYMSGLLWRDVVMKYSSFPYRLAGMALSSLAGRSVQSCIR